ncbi:hypothetical protein WMF20_45990 [Sorangium sp. So ce834]
MINPEAHVRVALLCDRAQPSLIAFPGGVLQGKQAEVRGELVSVAEALGFIHDRRRRPSPTPGAVVSPVITGSWAHSWSIAASSSAICGLSTSGAVTKGPTS